MTIDLKALQELEAIMQKQENKNSELQAKQLRLLQALANSSSAPRDERSPIEPVMILPEEEFPMLPPGCSDEAAAGPCR